MKRDKVMPMMQVVIYDGTNLIVGDAYQVNRIPDIGEHIIATLAERDQLGEVASIVCRCKDESYLVVAKEVGDVTGDDPGQIAEKLLGIGRS